MEPVKVIAVEGLPLIQKGDNMAELIVNAAKKQKTPLQDKDVIVVTHVAVSKAEGNIINLDEITPSMKAKEIAQQTNKGNSANKPKQHHNRNQKRSNLC
jgi:coenzyme F420-0:L-glutamate ligase/coenzyme F420-1:gamma-L-glutamate ligase